MKAGLGTWLPPRPAAPQAISLSFHCRVNKSRNRNNSHLLCGYLWRHCITISCQHFDLSRNFFFSDSIALQKAALHVLSGGIGNCSVVNWMWSNTLSLAWCARISRSFSSRISCGYWPSACPHHRSRAIPPVPCSASLIWQLQHLWPESVSRSSCVSRMIR